MYFDLLFKNIINKCGYKIYPNSIEKELLEYTYYKGDNKGRIVMYPTTLSEGCIFFYQTFGTDRIRTYGCASDDGNKLVHFDNEWAAQSPLLHIIDITRSFRKGIAILTIDEDEYSGNYCEIDTDCNIVRFYSQDHKEFLDGRNYLDNSIVQDFASLD